MSKIYVWGTGIILSRILDHRICLDDIEAFIDNNEKKKEYLGKKVLYPQEIESDYDAIVVANMHTLEIYNQCLELNIDINRVLFLYNNIQTKDINTNYSLMENILGSDYADIVKTRYHLVRDIAKDEVLPVFCNEFYETQMYKNDYVRAKTLELVAEEIRNHKISGEVAELGVFQGDFSQLINLMFPDKKLYLFDTFDSFDITEATREKDIGSCNEVFIDSFKNVNIEKVFAKMMHPENVIIKKGLFPESLNGLEEKFAFVSLDVDFEESTISGLEYFYPRLQQGGYIFIHDYNYGYFDCVKRAVALYEDRYHVSLCKVPICDAIGTLIITK